MNKVVRITNKHIALALARIAKDNGFSESRLNEDSPWLEISPNRWFRSDSSGPSYHWPNHQRLTVDEAVDYLTTPAVHIGDSLATVEDNGDLALACGTVVPYATIKTLATIYKNKGLL